MWLCFSWQKNFITSLSSATTLSDSCNKAVANYNHMHSLNVQYYEVVQLYNVIAQLHRADRVLFVPVQLLDFDTKDGMDLVEQYRKPLIRGALTRRIRSILRDDTTSVAVKSAMTVYNALAPFQVPGLQGLYYYRLGQYNNALAQASNALGQSIAKSGSNAFHLPDDVELSAVSFEGVVIKTVRLDWVGSTSDGTTEHPVNSGGRVDFRAGIRLVELQGISVSMDEGNTAPLGHSWVTLHCKYLDRTFSLPIIPLYISEGKGFHQIVSFEADQRDRRRELLNHLQNNREYYSQAIYRYLDPASLALLLSKYTWRGKPLIEQVEPTPVSVAGNFIILRAPIEDGEESGIPNSAGQMLNWGNLLNDRGLNFNVHDQRLIPIPTEGVWAEAVLGRSNSAEKLDITRFWNWQDSPIPLEPPEIAPVATGSRGTAETLTPGQLSPPVLNILNPTSLPDPAGIGQALATLANLNFRDMSGLAGTQELAGRAMSETSSAATAAGQLASENMRIRAQKDVAMAGIVSDLVKTAGAAAMAAAGVPPVGMLSGGKGGSNQTVSSEGARINHGRDMDSRGVPRSTGSSSGNSSAGGSSSGSSSSGGGRLGGGNSNTSSNYGGPSSREGDYADQGAFGYSPGAARDLSNSFSGLVEQVSDTDKTAPERRLESALTNQDAGQTHYSLL